MGYRTSVQISLILEENNQKVGLESQWINCEMEAKTLSLTVTSKPL